jgi:hypothetical protein
VEALTVRECDARYSLSVMHITGKRYNSHGGRRVPQLDTGECQPRDPGFLISP